MSYMIEIHVIIVRGFLDAGKDLFKLAPKIHKIPILYSHGDVDPVNDFKGTEKVHKLSENDASELKCWKGLFHECMYISPSMYTMTN